jgi:ribosomal protein S18 acetylase RimI-like enzyme
LQILYFYGKVQLICLKQNNMPNSPETLIIDMPNDEENPSLMNDASQLLSHGAYEGHISPEKVAGIIDAGHTIVALDQNRRLLGAGVLRHMDGSSEATIVGIAVESDYRGKGLGTKIIEQLERDAEDRKAQRLYIAPTNSRNGELYERLGYRASHEDPLTLHKELNDARPHN